MNKQLELILDHDGINPVSIPHGWSMSNEEMKAIAEKSNCSMQMVYNAYKYGFLQGAKAHSKGRMEVTARGAVIVRKECKENEN